MSFRSVTHATILSHTKEDSVLTYGTAITGVTVVSASEDVIDEADAVAASSSALPKSAEEVKSPSRQTPLSEPPQERNDDPKTMEVSPTSETTAAAVKTGASRNAGKPKTETQRKPTKTRSRSATPPGKAKPRPSSPAGHKAMDVTVHLDRLSELECESPGADTKDIDTITSKLNALREK